MARVSVSGFGRAVYVLESSTNLVNPVWVGIATNAGAEGVRQMVDPVSVTGGDGRYYRVLHVED